MRFLDETKEEITMQATTFKRSLLAAALIAAVGVGYAKLGGDVIRPADAVAALAAPSAAPLANPAVGLPDFRAIVEHSGPAVVNISAVGASKTAYSGGDRDERVPELFRHFGIPMPDGGAPSRGMGSGFIVSADGLILTNAHVVSDADEVTVKLTDKREFKARVVGLDKLTDIAVLRIAAKNLPVVCVSASPGRRPGRRMGRRHRLTVRLREQRHRRHRLGQGHARWPATATCRSSRPTWRSIRATPADP
jgi:serine protease Do